MVRLHVLSVDLVDNGSRMKRPIQSMDFTQRSILPAVLTFGHVSSFFVVSQYVSMTATLQTGRSTSFFRSKRRNATRRFFIHASHGIYLPFWLHRAPLPLRPASFIIAVARCRRSRAAFVSAPK